MTIERRAARVLLIARDAVLLLHGHDPARPDAGTWWMTPGGGVEPEETLEVAACREVLEETGLALTPDRLGAVVATRSAEFRFDAHDYVQAEWFFAVRLERFEPTAAGWQAVERRSLLGPRWWPLAELETTGATVYPRELVQVVRAVLAAPVTTPLILSGE